MGLEKSKQQQQVITRCCNINYFENLSNELIYELFDYFSFHKIIFSFGKLNSRLENLIETYAHYVNLQEYTENNRQILPRYIHSLKINARYQFSFINLSMIQSLHDLILSNLSIHQLWHIFNTLSLQELEYVYLGALVNYNELEEAKLGEIQQKILALGEWKLKKCVFRIRLAANMDLLPIKLPSLEYLRIDSCKNIFIINHLLDRMPNLRSLYVSMLGPIHSEGNIDQFRKPNDRHHCLTKLTIRIHDFISFEDLIPLFDQIGLKINNLIIYVNRIKENSSDHQIPNKRFLHLYQRMTTIINQFLPQLTNFHLRQSVLSQDMDFLYRPCYFPSYLEQLPSTIEHKSYRVSIAAHLATIWQNRT